MKQFVRSMNQATTRATGTPGVRWVATRNAAMAALIGGIGLAAMPAVCHADIVGLFVGTYDYNHSDSGAPPITDDDYIQLTTGSSGQIRSIFFFEPQDITQFTASFTYHAENPRGCGNGLCFVIQNSVNGTKALGGGTFGYNGIDKSAAVTIELTSSKSGFFTNGSVGGGSDSTSPVDLNSGNDIDVKIVYDGTLLFVDMVDTVTGDTYSSGGQLVGDLTSVLEGNMAFVGFTAASGTNCFSGGISHFLSSFLFYTDACPGDFNADGEVNTQDFVAFLNAWAVGDSTADFNDDGTVNTLDFVAFLNAWTSGCP